MGMVGWPVLFLLAVSSIAITITGINITKTSSAELVAIAATENTVNLIANALVSLPECFVYEENGRPIAGVVDMNKLRSERKDCVSLGPILWQMNTYTQIYCCNEAEDAAWKKTDCFRHEESHCANNNVKQTCQQACEEKGYKTSYMADAGVSSYCKCGSGSILVGKLQNSLYIITRKERLALLKYSEGTEKLRMDVRLGTTDITPVVTEIGSGEFAVSYETPQNWAGDGGSWTYEASILNLTDGSDGCGNLTNENIYISEIGGNKRTNKDFAVQGSETVFRIMDESEEENKYGGLTSGCGMKFSLYQKELRNTYEKVVIKELI